jgi:phosphonopyruvate decarboxylase
MTSMLAAAEVVNYLNQHGLGPYVGVPCSFLKPLINHLIDHAPGEYLPVNNEGEAIAIASGAYLAGRRPVVMFQNSGLGNAVNPLTSLSHVFRIPILIITTWRGEPDSKDEPQHQLMGQITDRLLDLMDIRHDCFPRRTEEMGERFGVAIRHLESRQTPYALIMHKNTLAPYDVHSSVGEHARPSGKEIQTEPDSGARVLRREAIRTVLAHVDDDVLMVATTGKTARELYELQDRAANFYVIGSMGCASSIALGVALSRPTRRVIVLDGDGAALMRLEAMVSIGHYAPANLTHVILDNQSYESTGGQQTLSPTVHFPRLAINCGYRTACSSNEIRQLAEFISEAGRAAGPHLVHFRVKTGSDPNLKRPLLDPPAIAARFRAVCSPSSVPDPFHDLVNSPA